MSNSHHASAHIQDKAVQAAINNWFEAQTPAIAEVAPLPEHARRMRNALTAALSHLPAPSSVEVNAREQCAQLCDQSAAQSQEEYDKSNNPFIRNALRGEIRTAKALAKNIRALFSEPAEGEQMTACTHCNDTKQIQRPDCEFLSPCPECAPIMEVGR